MVQFTSEEACGSFDIKADDDENDKQEQDTVAGLAHLKSLRSMHEDEVQVRMKILDDYEVYKDQKMGGGNFFTALTHLKRNLKVEDGGTGWWGSTVELREKVVGYLECPKAEVSILLLVLIDMTMVILEAVLDSVFVFSHGDHGGGHGDGHSDHGTDDHGTDDHGHSDHGTDDHVRRLRVVIRRVARPVIRGWVQEGSRFLASAEQSCGDDDGSCDIEKAYKIAYVCRWISISILFIFAFEIVLKFICSPRGFVRHFGHLLDVVVIGGSIAFEFSLHHSAGGLLIFFRCWRGVRIAHGLYEQVEYIVKALETEEHLEKALNTVQEYKAFTKTHNLKAAWKTFKEERRENPDEEFKEKNNDDYPTKEAAPDSIVSENGVTLEVAQQAESQNGTNGAVYST